MKEKVECLKINKIKMAKATFVKKSRKDIYHNGKKVEYVSLRGKQMGKTLSKIDRTIPRDKEDKIYINKGDSYYHWTLFRSATQYSKYKPRQSQLTNSPFLSQIYSISEGIEYFRCEDEFEFDDKRAEVLSELEELRDQCQESLDNMPDGLQQAPTGELLTNRIDSLDSMMSEIEGIEVEEIEEFEFDEDSEDDEETQEQDWNDSKKEMIDSAISELQNVSYDGE
jgi:hypothetical protein